MNSKTIWIFFVVLFFLHQDFWNWGNTSTVLGFMPVGLAYHALFSIAAALLWASAVKWAWPGDIEAWAGQPEQPDDANDNSAKPAADGGTTQP